MKILHAIAAQYAPHGEVYVECEPGELDRLTRVTQRKFPGLFWKREPILRIPIVRKKPTLTIADVYEDYATVIGKASLTDTEKKQAFLNAVLDGVRVEPFASFVHNMVCVDGVAVGAMSLLLEDMEVGSEELF